MRDGPSASSSSGTAKVKSVLIEEGESIEEEDRENEEEGKRQIEKTYVWLFGDSIVGTSTHSRRLDGKMVSNTVAKASVTPPSPNAGNSGISGILARTHFYWGSSKEGLPTAVFRLSNTTHAYASSTSSQSQGTRDLSRGLSALEQELYHADAQIWPLAGLAVADPKKGQVRVAVLAATVQQELATSSLFSDASAVLSFRSVGTVRF